LHGKISINNQTHVAAAVVFDKNIDAASEKQILNIRLFKKAPDNFWVDASTQNNTVKISALINMKIIFCCMVEYSRINGEWSNHFGDYNWKSRRKGRPRNRLRRGMAGPARGPALRYGLS
jgi:hypothetical protein